MAKPNFIIALTAVIIMLVKPVIAQTDSNLKVSLPLNHLRITSPFGWRIHPITGRPQFHNGVDLAAYADTVYCVAEGVVTKIGNDCFNGNFIWVQHSGGVDSFYGHLSAIAVLPGDSINRGQPIGITGCTGRTTGEHLHFTIRYKGQYLSPMTFLNRLLAKPP